MGFTSTLEMLVKLKLIGCRFAEVPFVLRYDQKTSKSKMLTSITVLGYFAMALLYHWPPSGWRTRYKYYRDRSWGAPQSITDKPRYKESGH